MEGRESLSMPDHAPFYMPRSFMGSTTGWHPGSRVPSPGLVPLPNNNPILPAQPHVFGAGAATGLAFTTESTSPKHGDNASAGGQSGGSNGSEPVKRKRGRPRKYGPDGKMALGLSPTTVGSDTGSGALVPYVSGDQVPKRGRGRPPGSGKKQQLASCGEWMASSAGSGFTPHVLTIPPGEDIASKITSFSQLSPRGICILAATGSVSTATLRQSASSDSTVTYEGLFEILSLSGSYILGDSDGTRNRSGGLAVSLSSPDGRVIGGGIGGVLTANTQVQVMVGSFVYKEAKNKSKSKPEPEADAAEHNPPADDLQVHSPPIEPAQNMSPIFTGWPGMKSSPIDIDLTRG